MTKKLFAVRPVGTKKLTPSTPTFATKALAKSHRRSLNVVDADDNEVYSHVVTFGPDHHKFGAA